MWLSPSASADYVLDCESIAPLNVYLWENLVKITLISMPSKCKCGMRCLFICFEYFLFTLLPLDNLCNIWRCKEKN